MILRVPILLLACLAAHAAAQVPDVVAAPPAISFSEWRRATETDNSREFVLTFPSAITTGYPENDEVHLRVLLPATGSGPFPSVVLLHYWGASDQRIDVALAQELNRLGLAAVLIDLPFHLGRTPKGSASGELAIQPHPDRLTGSMIQSLSDVRRTIDWIQTRPELDAKRIALAGTSLGGLVGALAYAVEPRITVASFVLAGADLAHILWHSSRVVAQRDELRRQGVNEDRLREAIQAIEPLTYLPSRAPGRTFVVGARYDTVIPPSDTQKLIDALPGAKTLWVDTGHYGGVFVQRKLLRLVARFSAAALSDQPFDPPEKLYAPTLRIGVELNVDRGLQVAAGLDIWRSSPRAEAFASFMVTPKGAQLYLGHTLGNGFSIGVAVRPTRASLGAFWSTIL